MIAVLLLLSKTFFPQHPKAGKETEFAGKVRVSATESPIYGNYYKIHTCRSNYEYWKKKIDKLKAEGGVLSVRQWSTNPCLFKFAVDVGNFGTFKNG